MGGGSDLPAPVGLGVGTGNQDIRFLPDDFRKQEFQLPGLVTSKGQARQVIALDVDVGTTQLFAQPWAEIQRSRQVCQ